MARRELMTTLLMGLAAATLAAIAAVCYPWPQTIGGGQRVNEPLFAQLDTAAVRGIAMVSYDRDSQRLKQVQLKRIRDQWVLPSANNYPAGNSALIGEVNNALSQAIVLEVAADSDERHPFFGVVDPELAAGEDQTGVGAKITLADDENQPLASLIVGERVGQESNQRFVRIAGEPSVYVTNFNSSLLATNLADWADHNLLSLKTTAIGPGFDIAALTVDRYTIPSEQFTEGDYQKKYTYRLRIDRGESEWQIRDFSKPNAEGQLAAVETIGNLSQAGLERIVLAIVQVPFENVIKMSAESRQALVSDDPNADLSSLANYGFRRAAGSDGSGQIDSSNGVLQVHTPDGIVLAMHFGRMMDPIPGSTGITYATLLTARVDPAAFPLPDQPAAEDEQAQRDYEREVQRRKDRLSAAQNAVKQFNARTADWLYFVSDAAVRAILPNEEDLVQQ